MTIENTRADPIADELKALKAGAWDARDLEAFDLYLSMEWERTKLRAVGRAVASLYQHASDDAAWSALYEALADAGLLTAEGEE